MPLDAVIFDFDGVVIDSHSAHERSWFMLAAEIQKTLTSEEFTRTFGQRNETILPLLGWADEGDHLRIKELGDRKEVLYREILAQEGIVALPGVVALLENLKAAGIPTAVGTSAQRKNIECAFGLLGISHLFQDVAASEDVTKGKRVTLMLIHADDVVAERAGNRLRQLTDFERVCGLLEFRDEASFSAFAQIAAL